MAKCLTWDYFLNACKRLSRTTKTSAFTLKNGVKRGRPVSFPNNRSTEWRVFVNAKSVLSALTNHVAAMSTSAGMGALVSCLKMTHSYTYLSFKYTGTATIKTKTEKEELAF